MARTNYFIKKDIQIRFIGTIFSIIALVVVVLFFNLYFFGLYLFQDDSGQKYDNALFENLKDDIQNKLATDLVLLVAANILIIWFVSLLFSHQIAGPIYQLEMTLQKIINDDASTRFSFRKSDKFDEVADLLNYMKDKFVEPLKLVRDINARALPIIDEIILKKKNEMNENTLSQLKDMHQQIANSILDIRFEAKVENNAVTPEEKIIRS